MTEKEHPRLCDCLTCIAKALGVPSIEVIGYVSQGYDQAHPEQTPRQILADRVAADLDGILNLHGETLEPAPLEMPAPPEDARDTYTYQFDVARRRCPHNVNVNEILWRREYQCLDCGKYIKGDFRRGYRY